MKIFRRGFLLAGFSASLPVPAAFAAPAEDPALLQAVASVLRSSANRARDRYRHPAEVLTFIGLGPAQSVLEIEPGAGYWTEILAPYLAKQGHYTAALPTGTLYAQKADQFFLDKVKANPAAYGKTSVIYFGADGHLGAPGSQDLILSFRNLHDWLANGSAAAMLAGIQAALKPGGVFGIEDHRAPATAPQDPKAKDGYVREDYAIRLIEAAGLKLAGRSEIGANPRDTKNYPDGVWDLPPVLRQGQANRAKYLAIGESDRWTLKFVKPA